MSKIKTYKLTSKQKQKESLLYTVNNILKLTTNKKQYVLALTSTLNNYELKLDICSELAENICKMTSKKVLLINVCMADKESYESSSQENTLSYDESSIYDTTSQKLKNVLEEKQEKYDLILAVLPPVNVFSSALECAKLCDGILLLERYAYTKYNNFEESLLHLKENNIEIEGIIIYK